MQSLPTLEELIRCTECQHSFYRISCVTPAVYDHIEDWTCGECDGNMNGVGAIKASHLDITEDSATLTYLRNASLPEEAERKEQNRIRNRAKNFVIREGKLYKRKDSAFGERPVPAIAERLGIVQRIHTIGHPGIDRLRKLVNQQFYWPSIGDMATSVRENCGNCQRVHLDAVVPRSLKPIPVYGVLQRWHIDLIGPFPTTARGNKYGIVAIDSVSKWTEAGALPNKTADNVKRWFWENIVCRYGTPQEIVTDNGGISKVISERCFSAATSPSTLRHHTIRKPMDWWKG